MLHILAWRTPLPDREAWQATVYTVAKSQTWPKRPCTHRCKTFLPVAVLPQWELSVKVAQRLGLRGPWQRQVCRDMDCLCCRCYGLIRVFFRSCCSWRSEGLFGQSFSLAPPVQALRGFPFLGPSPYSFNIFKICSDISLDNGNVFTLFSFSSSVWLGCN